jgi:RNA polymerase sigma factor (sigma-70 family)
MEAELIPPCPRVPDFGGWVEEHFERLLARMATFFLPSLRRCPLVAEALEGTLEALQADPGRFTTLDRLLQEHSSQQILRMMNNITGMAVNFMRTYPDLFRVVDEVPNEVYVQLGEMSSRGWFDPTRGGAFWGWLRSVTFHVAMKMLDREQKALRHAPLVPGAGIASAEPPPETELFKEPQPSIQELVGRMLTALPDPRDREVFRRRFLEGAGVEEIAGEFGLSPAAVYQRIHRLRRRLSGEGFGGTQSD